MRGANPPNTQTVLKNAIQDDFSDDFTATQVNAVLLKMVQFSRHDGTGTFNFYKEEVIK